MGECILFSAGGKSVSKTIIPITDGLEFALTTTFSDFSNRQTFGKPSIYGITTGIAPRTVELVNKCGTNDNFIISFGNGGNGQTFALTQTEFVGYYNGAGYGTLENAQGKTRHICCISNDKLLRIYVNGIKITDEELACSCNPTDNDFSINSWRGMSPISTQNCITHEVRVYNKMLTEDEIVNNFKYYKSKYNIV